MEEVVVHVPGKGEVRKMERRKVEMQVLHMSEESQTRVELALRELYGGQYQMRKAASYRDTGKGLDRRFWVRDRQLLVRGVELPGEAAAKDEAGGRGGGASSGEQGDGVSAFAMKKLEGCGFHPNRCEKVRWRY